MSCFGGCGYWRRRQLLLAQGGPTWGLSITPFDTYFPRRRFRRTNIPVPEVYPVCDLPYPTTIYPESRDGAAQAQYPGPPCPPPYSEVKLLFNIIAKNRFTLQTNCMADYTMYYSKYRYEEYYCIL